MRSLLKHIQCKDHARAAAEIADSAVSVLAIESYDGQFIAQARARPRSESNDLYQDGTGACAKMDQRLYQDGTALLEYNSHL